MALPLAILLGFLTLILLVVTAFLGFANFKLKKRTFKLHLIFAVITLFFAFMHLVFAYLLWFRGIVI